MAVNKPIHRIRDDGRSWDDEDCPGGHLCGDACCGTAVSDVMLAPEYRELIRQAFRLEWLTVAWMIVEGVGPPVSLPAVLHCSPSRLIA
jgi:hypothetical protein